MPAKPKSSGAKKRAIRAPRPRTPAARSKSPSIAQRFDLSERKIRNRLNYFCIGPDDEAAMVEIHAIIDPMIDSIVDVFYAHIGTFLQLTRIIEDHSSTDRLKKSLSIFIRDIGRDMGSIDYVERRLQVGLVHNRIGLKPRWYLGAYSLLQMHIHQILQDSCRDDVARYIRLTASLDRVLMFDVSLGIDAYHQDMISNLETSLKTIEENHKSLEKTARLDSLLGILNRKALMHAMGKEFERSRRYNHPMAILFIDFDHFKSINDTHGHQFGDRVLQTACATIRKTIREPDILGRYGGEELVVVLVECEPDNALNIAERIRRAIAGNVIQKRKTSIMAQVTVSIGVHYPNLARQRPATAVRYADKALYAAKKSGRNRVVVYEPGL